MQEINWDEVKMLRNDTPQTMKVAKEDHHGNDMHQVRILTDDYHINSILCEHQREINDIKQAILSATSLANLKNRIRNL